MTTKEKRMIKEELARLDKMWNWCVDKNDWDNAQRYTCRTVAIENLLKKMGLAEEFGIELQEWDK